MAEPQSMLLLPNSSHVSKSGMDLDRSCMRLLDQLRCEAFSQCIIARHDRVTLGVGRNKEILAFYTRGTESST
jgi:hypothetical protein